MSDRSVAPSPWWYRHRGSVIGTLFGLGFCFGNLRIDGATPLPAALVWGRHWGDAGVVAMLWIGVAFTFLAWLVRLGGTAYLRGEVVFAANVQRDRLIVDGIFRYVRNPLYLGNDFLALGIGLYAPPLGFAIIVIGISVFGVMLANEEARQLGRQYGAEFTAYQKAVPAFIPRLTPASFASAGRIAPDLRRAFLAESFTLALALALVPIAAFGDAGLIAAAVIFAVAIILFIVVSRMARPV